MSAVLVRRVLATTRSLRPSLPGFPRPIVGGAILVFMGLTSVAAVDDRPTPFGLQLRHGTGATGGSRERLEERRRAAQSGDARAQFDLGWIYASGLDVPRDYNQAVEWWQKAAAQGLADAQLNLGVMYQAGVGVAKDNVRAVE